MAEIPSIEGEIDFHVAGAGKPCKTWYTIFGEFPSSTGVPPLIVLHSSPGVPHNTLLPLRHLVTTHNIPVILYDQIGCGRSTHLPDKKCDGSFWTVDLFLKELENLLEHLGITEEYDLDGHSAGGVLAAEWAVRRPKGLRKLVLSSAPASKPLLMEAMLKLRSELPQETQDILIKHEEDGTIESPEYQQAKMFFFGKHLLRISPLPVEFQASMQALKEDNTVNFTMNGPYTFKRTGSTKDWSIIDRVHKINVPTLLLNGKYDANQDGTMEPFFNGIQKVKWVRFAESAHMPQFEEPDEFFKVLGGFLSMK